MSKLILNRTRFLKLMTLLLVGGSLGLGAMKLYSCETNASPPLNRDKQEDKEEKENKDQAGKYLFVWAGDQGRTNPDFLAVINFDEGSANYGRAITTVPLPQPGSTGNEPHHVGLSSDGSTLACGGLLSVLKGQKEIFFFDVSNADDPVFLSSADPPESAITDEFYPLAEGGFLVTMMGGAQGHHPGRVAEFDRDLNLVAEHPAEPPADGFNPH